jgi:hypothetical protein
VRGGESRDTQEREERKREREGGRERVKKHKREKK